MAELIPLIVTLVVAALIANVSVIIASRAVDGKVRKSLDKDRGALEATISAVTQELQLALDEASQMMPGEDLRKLSKDIQIIQAQIGRESKKLETAEGRLKILQTSIDDKEAAHNSLKVGKEESEQMAAQLLAYKEQWVAEGKQLEAKLAESRVHIDALSTELELTEGQKSILAEFLKSLDGAQEELREAVQLFEHSTERYLSLQHQHSEMEKEYKNLLEKQLANA